MRLTTSTDYTRCVLMSLAMGMTRALHKEGRRLYVEMSFAVVRTPAGTVADSVSVAHDSTARHEEAKARRLRYEAPPAQAGTSGRP